MNAGLWTVLFGLLTTALLGLPFFPVWREWWRPRDAQALALHDAHLVATQALTAQVRLSPGQATPPVVSASARILALAGCEFQQLNAPTILLGVASPVHTHAVHQVPRTVLQQPPHAERWGAHGWRITGDCHIPDAHQLQGPIVVLGRLSVGSDCLIDGDIKVHGSVQMGARSRVTGALVSEQRIELHERVWLQGPVLSESEVTLAGGVVIGSLDQPSTVRAAQVLAQAGAVVHGSICATQCGRVA
jgi:cytoskeletal protein CcmA (bactofilin family)